MKKKVLIMMRIDEGNDSDEGDDYVANEDEITNELHLDEFPITRLRVNSAARVMHEGLRNYD